jgi:hypothetical protein
LVEGHGVITVDQVQTQHPAVLAQLEARHKNPGPGVEIHLGDVVPLLASSCSAGVSHCGSKHL